MSSGLSTEAAIGHVIVSRFGDIRGFTVRPRSMRDKGSGSIGRRWATGQAAPASISSPSGIRCIAIWPFMDETAAPVLDPGRGQTKKGYFWAIVSDRCHGGPSPPIVLFRYASGTQRRLC